MTREELESAKAIKAELKIIERSLESAKSNYVVAFYKDYQSGRSVPKTEQIEVGMTERQMLEMRYRYRKYALQRAIEQIQAFIEGIKDPETRSILEGLYIADLTQTQIAMALHVDQSTVSRKLRKILDKL